MQFNPFFINTNLCYTQQECTDLPTFLNNVSGNTGNSYIAYSVIKLLYGKLIPVAEIKNLWTYSFQNQEALINQINQKHSHVILLLQDQIRLTQSYGINPNWQKINTFLKQLKKPFIVFSLGANDFGPESTDWWKYLSKDFIQFLHILSKHSTSLSVRGTQTLEILKHLGIQNAQAVGCPTFFEAGPNRKIIKKPLDNELQILGKNAFDTRTKDVFSGVIQDEVALMKILFFNDNCCDIKDKYSLPFLISLAQRNIACFAGMELWKRFVSKYKCCISYRMHGGILALNAGIPAIVLNKDLRATEMCDLFKIPHFPQFDHIHWKELYEQADFTPLNKAYPLLYRSFMGWLDKNGITKQTITQAHAFAETLPDIQEPLLPLNPHFSDWINHILKHRQYYVSSKDLIRQLLQKI